MNLAWKTAVETKDYDYYLLLNDDTFLFENSIFSSLNSLFSKSVIVGTTYSEIKHKPTYGGISSKTKKLIIPNGFYQNCDLSNGNFFLVPKLVFEKIGMLDPTFHHALGDYDYFYRGKKAGIEFYVAPVYVGICEDHISEFKNHVPQWRSSNIPLFTRLKLLYQPQSGCVPNQFFIYQKRHFGLLNAIYHYCLLHIRCTFPGLWKIKSLFKLS
jgi:GT2 family glycosyltransferase